MTDHDDELDAYRTDAQRQWRDWAAHGYRKRYMPGSMLWFGGVFFTLMAVGLGVTFWLAATGRMHWSPLAHP